MNTNLHPFTARYNGLKSFLKEYSKKGLIERLFVAGTAAVYSGALIHLLAFFLPFIPDSSKQTAYLPEHQICSDTPL